MCERKWVYSEIKKEIRDFLEFNGNECATCTISCYTMKMKVELKRKFTAQNVYMKKLESFHAGNLTAHYNWKKWGSNENMEDTSRNYRLGAETNKIEREEKELMKHGFGVLSLQLDKIHEHLLKDKEYQY